MKTKKLDKKLTLSKVTVVNLENDEQRAVRGGYYPTRNYGTCFTWNPMCPTQPVYDCHVLCPASGTDSCP